MKQKERRRSRKIKFFLLLGLLLTFVLILIISVVGRREFSGSHKFALEVIGSGQTGISALSGFMKTVALNYVALINVREENTRLREELQNYKAHNVKFREAAATNIRLAKLLELKEALPPPTLAAEIVGRDPSPWFKTLIINKGSTDGIEKGMPVLTVEGVVGQIVETTPHFSKIILATDPNSAIDAMVQTTRAQGMIRGTGSKEYTLEYVLRNDAVTTGDHVITSGLGGVFPKGIPVGTVSNVITSERGMFHTIEVTPSVDFSKLEYIVIILKSNSLAE